MLLKLLAPQPLDCVRNDDRHLVYARYHPPPCQPIEHLAQAALSVLQRASHVLPFL